MRVGLERTRKDNQVKQQEHRGRKGAGQGEWSAAHRKGIVAYGGKEARRTWGTPEWSGDMVGINYGGGMEERDCDNERRKCI